MHNAVKRGLFVLPVSLGLFFVLFFTLCYPEIKAKHATWPTTRCNIRSANLASRYCCESICACVDAPANVTSCAARLSTISNGLNPDTCSKDKSACPQGVGDVCDGGSRCCLSSCDTCSRCSPVCITNSSGSRQCHSRCRTYQCNCHCMKHMDHQRCTLSCPSCYAVDLSFSYSPGRGGNQLNNVTRRQDFSKNQNEAQTFLNTHAVGSTTPCSYNPRNLNEVSFNTPRNPITPWKWAVAAVFGMLPLFLNLCLLVVLPVWHCLHKRDRSTGQLSEPDSQEDAEASGTAKLLQKDDTGITTRYQDAEFAPDYADHDHAPPQYRDGDSEKSGDPDYIHPLPQATKYP